MDQLHEVKVGKGMRLLLISLNAVAASKSIQFVFVVGQTQVIDVVIVVALQYEWSTSKTLKHQHKAF